MLKASTRDPAATPWVEKYRPRRIEDVASQEEVTRTLKQSAESRNLPHLLFYGPAGTGKTSTILAICRELYGDRFKELVMELNASDERGIAVVKNKIKNFARLAVSSSGNVPPYKIIILDEADSMTNDAQTALRRTMETYSKVTRFCLICNYISRIIEPLASRCAKFRFKSLERNVLGDRLSYVAHKEGVTVSPEILECVAQVSKGDLRKAITYLQSVSRFYGNDVTTASVYDVAGTLPPDLTKGFLMACKSNSFEQMQAGVTDLCASGYSTGQIIEQIFEQVVTDPELSDVQKSKISIKISEVDRRLADGSDEYLQLLDMAAHFMRTANEMTM